MRVPIVYFRYLPAAGMAIFPFIFIKEKHYKQDKVLVNHEKIHLVQQLELLLIFFYVIYLGNYLYNLWKYKNHNEAYMNIVFEKEAYSQERNLSYLKNRKIFAWKDF